MPVIRTYQCEACAFTFQYTHPRSDDPYPPCPNCQANDPAWRPQGFRMRSTRAKAAKVAQNILEKDYGLTNFNDGAREGEVAAKGLAPQTTAEREKMVQQISESTRQYAEAMRGTLSPETQAAVKDTSQIFGATNGQMAAVAANPQIPRNINDDQMMTYAKVGTAGGKQVNGGMTPTQLLHSGLKSGRVDPLRMGIMAKAPLK